MGEQAAVVGFTGSRDRPTQPQWDRLTAWFMVQPKGHFHHGDCVGLDEIAHGLALFHGWWIEVHPAVVPAKLRAFVTGYNVLHPVKPPLNRNTDIVTLATELLACPNGPETLRSGTWSTVRKARAKGIRRTIIWPDGSVTVEPGDCEGYGTEQPQAASQALRDDLKSAPTTTGEEG